MVQPADQQNLSILLPHSEVVIYAHDEQTRKAAQQAANDWRFARVRIKAIDGDIDTTIQTCATEGSPDLLIIQTDTTDSTLTQKLEKLAQHCDEDTAAIIIGPVNDVNLYRALTDMGVSDYLVAPIDSDDLAEIIAKTLVDRLGVADSRLIAFTGAKGGVGTTALSQATAWAASEILQQKTLILDGAGGWSSQSVGLGFEPTTTLSEAAMVAAAEDEESLDRMITKLSNTLSVLASGGEAMLDPTVRTDQLEDLLGMLMVKYPVLIADLSLTPAVLQKTILMRASRIFVVSTPSLPSLRLARSLIQELSNLRGEQDGVVDFLINMQGFDKTHDVSLKDIEAAMGRAPKSIIPFKANLFVKQESEGKNILTNTDGKAVIEQHIMPLLREVLSLHNDPPAALSSKSSGLLSNLIGKIKRGDS